MRDARRPDVTADQVEALLRKDCFKYYPVLALNPVVPLLPLEAPRLGPLLAQAEELVLGRQVRDLGYRFDGETWEHLFARDRRFIWACARRCLHLLPEGEEIRAWLDAHPIDENLREEVRESAWFKRIRQDAPRQRRTFQKEEGQAIDAIVRAVVDIDAWSVAWMTRCAHQHRGPGPILVELRWQVATLRALRADEAVAP